MRKSITTVAIMASAGLVGSLIAAPAFAEPEETAPDETEVTEARSSGPKVKWDWSMPPGMVDEKTWNPVDDPSSPHYLKGGYFTPGPDGMPDKFMKKVKGYPEAGRSRYGKLPDNGLHKVYLDASRSSGTGKLKCSWWIDSTPSVTRKNTNCNKPLGVKLPEGKHPLTLEVKDKTGKTTVDSKIKVDNILIGIMGDSYGSGEGFPPFTMAGTGGATRDIHWDHQPCNRSHWSGFVRSAQTVENADKRSNVTLLDVACAGGQVSKSVIPAVVAASGADSVGGIISPQPVMATDGTKFRMPAQTDQLRAIVGNRAFDTMLLSIGGNDVGFGPISKTCLEDSIVNENCYAEKRNEVDPTKPLWEAVNTLLLKLEKRYDKMAPCVSSTGGEKRCKTFKITSSGGVAAKRTKSKPVIINKPKYLLHAMYPDLTTTTNSQGQIVPCTDKRQPGDLLPQSPMNQISNSWAWDAAYQGKPGKTVTLPTQYSPPLPPPVPPTITPTAPGLAQQVRANRQDFGWTAGMSMMKNSRGHGLCATDDPWLYGLNTAIIERKNPANENAAEHPNEAGQQAYADMMGPKSTKLNNLPVSKPRTIVRPNSGLG